MATTQYFRLRWIKFMYLYTIIGAGVFGLGMIFIPDVIKSASNWPANEPVIFSITGSLFTALGIVSIFGLISPMKFVPLLLLQLCYKLIWFLLVVIPMLITGRFPSYAIPIAIFWLTYVVGDLIAIPFRYLFNKQPIQEMSPIPDRR